MSERADFPEYDELDVLVTRLIGGSEMPVPTIGLTAEMVEFYKTPVRVILELVERASFGPEPVFFDLGSGLGQTVMLVNILAGVMAKGIEIEPAYCEYARACAAAHGLSDVEFIEGDVRNSDLSTGTVFFLFTPFMGSLLAKVMERLRALASTRVIQVISYGPCSAEISRLAWLTGEGDERGGEYTLQIFNSSI
jgi:SAM-dependent methyltransferase